MFVIDLFIAIIAPLFIPALYHFLSTPQKPQVTPASSAQKAIYEKNVSNFMKKLPIAYVWNAVWGITYRFISGETNAYWSLAYCFVAISSCVVILKNRQIKNPIIYQIVVVIIYLILSSIAIARIFNLIA